MDPTQPSARLSWLRFLIKPIALLVLMSATGYHYAAEAQQDVKPAVTAAAIQYREVRYTNEALLIHLRTGYERIIVMPEPVHLRYAAQTLPGTDIMIDHAVITFNPAISFKRRPVVFVGQHTGTEYDLRIRASSKGFEQSLRISYP